MKYEINCYYNNVERVLTTIFQKIPEPVPEKELKYGWSFEAVKYLAEQRPIPRPKYVKLSERKEVNGLEISYLELDGSREGLVLMKKYPAEGLCKECGLEKKCDRCETGVLFLNNEICVGGIYRIIEISAWPDANIPSNGQVTCPSVIIIDALSVEEFIHQTKSMLSGEKRGKERELTDNEKTIYKIIVDAFERDFNNFVM